MGVLHDAENSTEYKDRFVTLDIQPKTSRSAEAASYLKADLAKWAKVVKDAGIKPE